MNNNQNRSTPVSDFIINLPSRFLRSKITTNVFLGFIFASLLMTMEKKDKELEYLREIQNQISIVSVWNVIQMQSRGIGPEQISEMLHKKPQIISAQPWKPNFGDKVNKSTEIKNDKVDILKNENKVEIQPASLPTSSPVTTDEKEAK